MATIDNNVQADSEIIKSIFPYLNPNYSFCENMMKDGQYQRDRLVEFALARQSKGLYNTDSQDNWDFTDHSDSKSATINYRKSQGIHGSILISGVSNKHTLRCLVYDPKRNTIRYIAIWKWSKSMNRIEFSANPSSDSKYINGDCGIEFNTFQELAQFNFKNK
tara:strand:- start:45 stop:533 length:489 start_codon:yes stop_codon:yes gene_type:complete